MSAQAFAHRARARGGAGFPHRGTRDARPGACLSPGRSPASGDAAWAGVGNRRPHAPGAAAHTPRPRCTSAQPARPNRPSVTPNAAGSCSPPWTRGSAAPIQPRSRAWGPLGSTHSRLRRASCCGHGNRQPPPHGRSLAKDEREVSGAREPAGSPGHGRRSHPCSRLRT